ncbi:inactive protein RESTRICTED TEV MOVEMENT 2-like [Ziziphus jujuba]|uniref:Inactive protein RESTRICTED TEV MOVEMENT 2-like n=1 Tax=Ziziphus jujuba TaxID=326968 RepID=A0A6P4BUE0_ZIZJJ|nr:inactive protein RESTRICTED TEV MOVEMENT 2-like [Ziziphus jujuba]
MAMRQRGTGYSTTRPRQTNRPIYEDFQPMSETKDEEGAQIVTFHLPGFLKEQIKLTAVHYPRIIRVQGERPLGNNKWRRFTKTVPIPQNCEVNKVHSKISNGVLTVFLPKKEITTKTSQPAAEKPKTTEATPSTSKASRTPRSSPPKTVADSDQQKAQKLQDDEKQKDDQGNINASLIGPQKVGVVEQRVAKGQEDLPPKGVSDAENYGKQSNDQKTIDHPLKNVVEKIDEKAKVQNSYLQEKERMKKSKESSTADISAVPKKVIEKEEEKEKKSVGTSTKEKQIKELLETSIKKDEGEKDEERKTLINIGGAVLVLVSFGVYVSYSLFGSLGKTKDA